MLRIMLSTVCVAFIALSPRADDKAAAEKKPSIDGHWAVTDASVGGKKVELPHDWTFKPNGKANLIDRKAQTQSVFRYKVDNSVTAHRIELTYLGPDAGLKNLRQLGIWKLSGDQLTMLLKQPSACDQPKNDEYPADFAKPGKNEMLLTLQKMPVE